VSLAEFLAHNAAPRVDLMKIDVEGCEFRVLSSLGLGRTRVNCLYVEILDRKLRQYDSSQAQILEHLHANGYVCFNIVGDPANVVAVSDPAHLRGLEGRVSEVRASDSSRSRL
jgi:hypothetical protein